MSPKNKKSLWPIGILLVILLGVILIIVSVRISKMQSIDPSLTYGMKKVDLDTKANALLENQNKFESEYAAFVGVNSKEILPDSKKFSELKGAYYTSPVPKDLPNSKYMLHGNDSIYIIFEPKSSKIDNLVSNIESISLQASRILPDDKNMERLNFNTELNTHESDKLIYVAHNITLPHKGYYEVDFIIKLKDNENEVVFSKWLFNN
ncbi:hypothetical protein DCO58_10525 [Helicobacter saguini]|uniref:Uncharacterized protein n=1 Tax=Helicobacter saguini TaxID=1548018 RepID=A0A347VPP8_9HELI|nr:hypothetical protein [Helicobacter saguini]MWV61266.1 hypothetical protein [Helicobacter saguini]MWV68067.1 hypothetical protein [Helicobacter saguini]MWV70470.1 hypothetical protein [Helicobacter saguini]MWV72371.1 hypothetical protein [Helicobacter saguini]TLD92336.1 hypothetical protein LS64_010450 [Helicobacter saguini]